MELFRKKTPEKKTPKLLVESWSPVCDIQAFAEESETCIYFYLWRDPNTDHAQVKCCWVCNTAPAPEEIDEARARREADQAREALLQKRSRQEHQVAQATLARALNRLRVKALETR